MLTEAKIPVAIVGAAGRMGRMLCELAVASDELELVEAVDTAGHGMPAAAESDVLIGPAPSDRPRAVIEFALPAATATTIAHCRRHHQALVIGTTGLTDADHAAIDQAAADIPICQATNFSLVVNVLTQLAARAAQLLGDAYDIEIHEAHHRHKKDAPSGTALSIAQAICAATGRDNARDVLTSRAGDDVPRRPGQITVQALRLGDVVGEHTVHYATAGERMELKHIGTSRESYATGALRAAAWLTEQSPGRYTMSDVLGL